MSEDPIIKLLIVFLTTPSSNFYIAKLIQQSKSPVLEPLQAANINLGSQNILGVSIALDLQNVNVAGLANIQIAESDGKPQIQVNGSDVKFTAEHPNTQAPPTGVPKRLTLQSNFIATPASSPKISGSATITVNEFSLEGEFSATSSDGSADKVNIDFKRLQIDAAASANNITIDLKLNSTFAPFINQILKQAGVLSRIIEGVQQTLNSANVLSSISQAATQAARTALADKLVGA